MGCVGSSSEGLTLTSTKGNKIYALSGDSGSLKAGEQVGLKGRMSQGPSATLTFEVEKLTKDYGACHPGTAPRLLEFSV